MRKGVKKKESSTNKCKTFLFFSLFFKKIVVKQIIVCIFVKNLKHIL